MKTENFIKNWTHINLVKDLRNKAGLTAKSRRRNNSEIPYAERENQMLMMSLDRFSEDLTDEQRTKLHSDLSSLIKGDPLTSETALNRTDGLRMKFYPYFRRGAGLRNQKKKYVKYLKSPQVPQMLVRNVWKIDLGMANTVENRQALKDIGWEYPDSGEATKTQRIACYGFAKHHIFGLKQYGKRDPDSKGPRPVTQVELLAVPVTLLNAMIGYEREDGSRSTANIPESWRRWQSNEVEEAIRMGRSAEGRQPIQAKVTRSKVKPKGKKKPIGQRNRGKRAENTAKQDEDDSHPVELLREKYGFMTVKELRNLCTDNKVVRGGNKAELLFRLYDLGVLEL